MEILNRAFIFGGGATRSRAPIRRCSRICCFVVAAGILASGFASARSVFAATPAEVPAASAANMNGTNAELNGARMTSGATLFPGDVIRLGVDSSVALQFGKDLMVAAPLTEFVVESAGVTLRTGRIQVRANRGESFAVTGPFFQLKLAPTVNAPSSAEIRVGGAHASVSAVAGNADLTADGSDMPYKLHAGETADLDAGNGDTQNSANPAAGEVSRLLAKVQIDRSSRQLVAAVSSPVFWNDDLHSSSTGRARVALKDGSVLNLGSNSELRVLQHDAGAQQTSLDLAVGRMRGQVIKLTRPQAKFEIRTPVGMAGLVGTDFYLNVTADNVELIVFEGAVRFIPFSTGEAVIATAGMKILISKAGAVTGPSPAKAEEIQTAKNLTDVPNAPPQSTVAGGRRRKLVPVLVTISAGGAVTGIGLWLSSHEQMSPSTMPN